MRRRRRDVRFIAASRIAHDGTFGKDFGSAHRVRRAQVSWPGSAANAAASGQAPVGAARRCGHSACSRMMLPDQPPAGHIINACQPKTQRRLICWSSHGIRGSGFRPGARKREPLWSPFRLFARSRLGYLRARPHYPRYSQFAAAQVYVALTLSGADFAMIRRRYILWTMSCVLKLKRSRVALI